MANPAWGFVGSTMKGPIRAYHGSPYDFDAFDAAKIGNGEGAQAYGHGLYFAEAEPVAETYKHALADRKGSRALADPSLAELPNWVASAIERGTPGE